MRPVNPRLLTDVIRYYRRVDDRDGDYAPTIAEGAAATMTASVQPIALGERSGVQAAGRVSTMAAAILLGADPGDAIARDSKIEHVASAAGPIDPPAVYNAEGPPSPPSGGMPNRVVTAIRTS